MNYIELKQIFQELNRTSPKDDLTAHITFTEDSFEQRYSLLSRTYLISSDSKGFWPHMFSRYGFGGTCIRVCETNKNGKIRLEPLAGNQAIDGKWVNLSIDRVYGYCTLLERYLNREDE